MGEISRVTDHLTCIAASAMEMGAMTAFLYLMRAREYLYDIIEEVTGAMTTISYCRIGGVKGDLPEGLESRLEPALVKTEKEIGRWISCSRGTGSLSTGPAMSEF